MKNIEKWNGRDIYLPFTYNTSKKELRNSSSQLSWIENAYFFDKTKGSPTDYNRSDIVAGLQGLHLEVGLDSGLVTGLPIMEYRIISRLLIKLGASDDNMNNVDLNLLRMKKGFSFFDGSQHLGMCL